MNERKRRPEIKPREDRVYPHDINAEAAVLSAMMVDATAVPRMIDLLDADHFYRTAHKVIFRVMKQMFENSREIDLITLLERLESSGQLEEAGGKIYLSELNEIVISAANVMYHGQIVLEKAILRFLIEGANKIVETAYTTDEPIDKVLDYAEQTIFSIAENSTVRSIVSISDLITPTLNKIDELATKKTGITGIPSGFHDLDSRLGGFRPGQLVIVAARPGMGKSAFALNMGFHAAYHFNKKVAIFSLEMEAEEILMRLFSSHAEIPMNVMLKGFGMDQQRLRSLVQVGNQFAGKPVFIDDTGSNSALDIRAKARRLMVEQGGLDMIIIDYLQLMSSRTKIESRQQEIADISRSLKNLAKELKIPIIALSQLNRMLEQREDKRPILSDLRESGAIEQDADVVLFIYRDIYNKNDVEEDDFPSGKGKKSKKQKILPDGVAEIIVAKNRHGPTDRVHLRFVGEYTLFQNLDPHEYPDL